MVTIRMTTTQNKITNNITLEQLALLCQEQLNQTYKQYLTNIPSLELKTAMEYTLFNSGKQLRPLLIYATGSLFNAPLDNLTVPAAAVELIHTYSLIHDDLPCMDNADLRRGKPTCHKVYSEAMAVLTGDALHTLAMQIMAHHPAPLTAEKRLRMIKTLSKACGPFGMAAGQALDINVLQDKNISNDLLIEIYRLKTGALFTACIQLGWLASNDDDELNQHALQLFGDNIGLAFQIQDDILDIEASAELSGKTSGLDHQNNKITYPKIHGLVHAKEKVARLYEDALTAINYLGHQAEVLRELARQMLERNK